MATGVGLRIAEDECLVAIVTSGGGSGALLPQPPVFIVREPVLHMSDDGDTELGGDPPAGHTHSITSFVSAVGDPAGIPVDDGEAYRAEDLMATALFCLIDLAAAHLEGPAEFYAVHPAHWPAAQVLALRDALDYLGLRSVVLVSEAILPDAATGREYAAAAARGALAAVLSTPAGATPPDPTRAENPLEATDVLPALATPEHAQAYSAAIPVGELARARLVAAEQIAAARDYKDGESLEPAATTVAPALISPASRRRTPVLIAAAAALGLLLGGVGVGFVLSTHSATPGPGTPDAHSDFTPTTVPTTIPLPPPPVVTRKPTPVPRQVPARRTEVPTTTPPPPTTTPAPTAPNTTPDTPTTTSSETYPYWYPYPTTQQSPYQPFTVDPFAPSPFTPPTLPMNPGPGYPSASTQGNG